MHMKIFNSDMNKDIMKLAWPTITEQTLIMMVNVVSTIFVSRIGKEAMTAVGLINTLVFFFQTVFMGLSTGTTVVIARLIGEGSRHKAKLALIQSFYLCIASGLTLTVFGYIFAYPLIKMFLGSAGDEVFQIGLSYFRIILIGLAFMVFDMVIAGAVRGAGDTRTPLYVTAIVNIINVVLCSTIIFGVEIGGSQIIPALGATGAAISVTAARICGVLMRLTLLFWKKSRISLTIKDKFVINKAMMVRIVRVGGPALLEQVVMQGGFLFMSTIIISMGTVAAASFQIGGNINSMSFMPIFGFAITATTLVGQSLGRKDYDKAELYANSIRRISIVSISCIGVLLFIFARPLANLYSTEPEVIKSSIPVIRIFAVLVPFTGIMNISSAVLRAAGDVMYVTITAIVGLWLFRVLIVLLMNKFLNIGVYGIMIGVSLDFIVRAAMYFIREKKGNWKYLKV